jgi:hypothetical protein
MKLTTGTRCSCRGGLGSAGAAWPSQDDASGKNANGWSSLVLPALD